jgi:hypothetical protein
MYTTVQLENFGKKSTKSAKRKQNINGGGERRWVAAVAAKGGYGDPLGCPLYPQLVEVRALSLEAIFLMSIFMLN